LPFLPSASISSPDDVIPDLPATGPPAGLAAINAADPFGLSAATAAGGGLDDEDFAQQLQAGMADLLGELESSPEMQRQFEDMLRELGAAGAVAPGGAAGIGGAPAATTDGVTAGAARDVAAAAAEGGAGAVPPLSFQESIQRTMERMQESGDAAGAAAASSGQSEADLLAAMLREMESGGEGSDEDFSKMLYGMMEQLTNKDILYEPMKELDSKFPDWMEKNGSTVPEADMKRYETQQRLVREIIQKFEEPGYTDENVDSRKYIVDRMQEVRH
jgi:peroxin-19